MKPDFEYIKNLIVEFTALENIQVALNIIDDQLITGWETWFQIEFARFLTIHESEPIWGRELKLEFDYRKEKEKHFFKPDFIIRKKGWRKESYAALEIKQHHSATTCVTNMVTDIIKVSKIRNSELDLRSYWVLGIFKTESISDPYGLVLDKCSSANVAVKNSLLHVDKIESTAYSYVLF